MCEILALSEHPHDHTFAVDRTQFIRALDLSDGSRLRSKWLAEGVPPVIHLSMHGNQDGIALTSGENISWGELREILMPINASMQNGLLVCLSTCYGYSGTRMDMYFDEKPPFWAIVGSGGDVTWGDSLQGFSTFYHHWFKGAAMLECAERMRQASGHSLFLGQAGKDSRSGYANYLRTGTFTVDTVSAPTTVTSLAEMFQARSS